MLKLLMHLLGHAHAVMHVASCMHVLAYQVLDSTCIHCETMSGQLGERTCV